MRGRLGWAVGVLSILSLLAAGCAGGGASAGGSGGEQAATEGGGEAGSGDAAPSDAAAGASEDPMTQAVGLLNQAVRGQSVDLEGDSGITIGVLIPWFDGEGFQANYVGMAAEAIESDVSMITADAQRSPEQALAAVEDMISQEVDAIVLDPFDSAALSAAVERGNEAGIPVVAYDQGPASGELAGLVASDNVAIGAKAAEMLVDAAEAQGLAVEDLKVIELLGDLASESGQDRHEGFSTRAEELGIEIVAELPTNWDDSQANAAVLDGFTANPDANAVFMASGCAMYTGVESALRSLDKLRPRGEEGHVLLMSVDGCPAPVQGIRDGWVDGDSAQQLLVIGQRAMEIAVAVANGEDPGETQERLGPDPITPENVDDETHWANVIDVGAN